MGRLKQACAVLGGALEGEPCPVCEGTDHCPFEQEVPDEIEQLLPENDYPTRGVAHSFDEDEF